MKKTMILVMTICLIFSGTLLWAAGGQAGGGASGQVTIEMTQWWQPEMPAGSFEKVISDFEARNPNIRVNTINLPYSQVLEQLTVGGATGTLSDVYGMNPPWLRDFIRQGIIEPLDEYIARDNYDMSQLATTLEIEGNHWMFPVSIFLTAVYYNVDHFRAVGLTGTPATREEFVEYARRLTVPARNQYGWVIPLGLANPNGSQHEVLNWAWAGGHRALRDGRPNVDNPGVASAVAHIQTLYRDGLVVPGAFTKVEQEKIEDFSSGRTSMLISSNAHINLLRQRNPNLNFDIFRLPSPAGFTGRPAVSISAWWISMFQRGRNKDAAWQLVKHFLDVDQNSHMASNANSFPGNRNSRPDFVTADDLFAKFYEIFQTSELLNEFNGLPNAPGLQRAFVEELHALLENRQDVNATLRNTQARWQRVFAEAGL